MTNSSLGATTGEEVELVDVDSSKPQATKKEGVIVEHVQCLLEDLKHSNKRVVFKALEKLFYLVQKEEYVHCCITKELDAPALIVYTMVNWSQDEPIQIWGSGCLGFLSGQCEQGRWTVIEAKTMEAITTAMKTFPDSNRVQSNGCGVLVNLLGREPTTDLELMTRDFVEEHQGLELIQEAMFKFPRDPEVQRMGCAIFWRMSLDDLEFHVAM